MKHSTLCVILGSLGAVLSGCSPVTPLTPEAENVMIADGSHLPQCRDLGHITTYDTNGSSVAYTSHELLQENQTNQLKNKTAHLGGNVLVITKHSTTYVSSKEGALVDTHSMEGDAYFCPNKKLEKPMPEKAASDIRQSDD